MPDAAQHQAAQAGIARLVHRDLAVAWEHLDPTRMKDTLPVFTRLVMAISRRYGSSSGALSARFYQSIRSDHGLPPTRVRIAPGPTEQQVARSVQWATSDLWAAPRELKVIDLAHTKVDGVVTRLAQDVGRATVVGTVKEDPTARGWARIPEADPCAFCALLAIRGAVYKTADTAGRDANDRFTGSGAFKFHDHCRCHVEPVFTAYEPSAQIRQWEADYKQATKGVPGGGTNLLNAWRQALEGRTTSHD